ncbi:MAG: hypothetical protein EB115_09690 [Betaproteobacteria bacterium]|nr:hypothetical protein [Betaproteobacteria bacterium]
MSSYGLSAFFGLSMVVCVFVGANYEREFRSNLEQGFQQRVELGDLASSVQQLRRTLDAPRALDPGFIGSLIERTKEVESKAKAQNDAGKRRVTQKNRKSRVARGSCRLADRSWRFG